MSEEGSVDLFFEFNFTLARVEIKRNAWAKFQKQTAAEQKCAIRIESERRIIIVRFVGRVPPRMSLFDGEQKIAEENERAFARLLLQLVNFHFTRIIAERGAVFDDLPIDNDNPIRAERFKLPLDPALICRLSRTLVLHALIARKRDELFHADIAARKIFSFRRVSRTQSLGFFQNFQRRSDDLLAVFI
jgi:hypothetical protein